MENLKPMIEQAQQALFRYHDEEKVRQLYAADYVQHNPHVPTGIEALIAMLPELKSDGLDFKTHRMLQDGELVLCHNSFINADRFGAKEIITFDLWRVVGGKVVEHWDCITPKVGSTVSGRSQTDGITEVTDLNKTTENKQLVESFFRSVLLKGDTSVMSEYFSGNVYAQHNPKMADGMDTLKSGVESMPEIRFHQKIHRVVGEGNFVLVQVEGAWGGKPQAIYDLFRVEQEKIVEHWDIYQEIPSEMAHENGMF